MRADSLSLALLATGLASLAAVGAWGPPPPAAAPPVLLPGLAALAVLAGTYAPLGLRTLGLATCSLPAAVVFFGPAAAGGVGGAVLLASLAARRAAAARRLQNSREWLLGGLQATGVTLLAGLAAGLVWLGAASWRDASPAEDLVVGGGAAAGAYLATALAVDAAASRRGGRASRIRGRWGAALSLDLAGWLVGLLLVRVALSAGWGVALGLLLALGLLAVEAARLERSRALADRRTRELREVALAGDRIAVRHQDLAGIAEQILHECRRVVPFQWFGLELEGAPGERSWRAGPDFQIEDGRPEPPPAPPALPGIHRRSEWLRIERELASGGETLAVLKLWGDPRRVGEEELELLDSLLPQMTSSLARALLDRLALRDPLTDLPDRRAFDTHLERAFEAARERGGSLAVIMCDVDNFKRINDLHGHAVGDQALLLVAHLLEGQRREDDFCSRLGGDEFAVVLERTDGKTALAIAERIRQSMARERRPDLQTRIPLRLTAGVAALPELPVPSSRDLLELADEALYEAKRRGRNRCLLHRGRGRFETADGKLIGDRRRAEPKPPTLFA